MVNKVSSEAVQAIRDAEEKAAAIRTDAQMRAQALLAEARTSGEENCKKTEIDTRAELKAMLAEMKIKATGLIERSRSEAAEEAAAMRTASEPKKAEAAKLIIRRLVEKCQ
jgi:vacuolar-type H+-ATPase subunit H